MNKSRNHFVVVLFLLIVVVVEPICGQTVDQKKMAASVKAEFLHAWTGYKQYCWGHDDLKPISKTCRDWYGQTILMTPVDSLDSLYLLGFKKEADETREYIVKNLSYDKDVEGARRSYTFGFRVFRVFRGSMHQRVRFFV